MIELEVKSLQQCFKSFSELQNYRYLCPNGKIADLPNCVFLSCLCYFPFCLDYSADYVKAQCLICTGVFIHHLFLSFLPLVPLPLALHCALSAPSSEALPGTRRRVSGRQEAVCKWSGGGFQAPPCEDTGSPEHQCLIPGTVNPSPCSHLGSEAAMEDLYSCLSLLPALHLGNFAFQMNKNNNYFVCLVQKPSG